MKRAAVWLAAFVAAALVAFSATPAAAVEDTYWAFVDSSGDVLEGGGTGYNEGEWYFYGNTGWWNQWFYNAPYDPDRWKEIDVYMEVLPYWENAYAEITINWSNPEWSLQEPPPDGPPLPPLTQAEEDLYISRWEPLLFAGDVPVGGVVVEASIVIPDYNPEWVSIDVRGYGFGIENGWIDHRCVPEPATLALAGLGVLALLARRRRRG